MRGALARVLTLAGSEVVQAASGAEAIALFDARTPRFRAVVLDLVMPGMGGRPTYLGLRAIDPEVPVLLVSGNAANDEVQALFDLGVRGFLAKPCSIEGLAAAVADLLVAPGPRR